MLAEEVFPPPTGSSRTTVPRSVVSPPAVMVNLNVTGPFTSLTPSFFTDEVSTNSFPS